MSVNFLPQPVRDPRAADPLGIADIRITPTHPGMNAPLKVEITRVFGGPAEFEIDARWSHELITKLQAACEMMARRRG